MQTGLTGERIVPYGWTPPRPVRMFVSPGRPADGPVLGVVTADTNGYYALGLRVAVRHFLGTYPIVVTGVTSGATGPANVTITGVIPVSVYLWPDADRAHRREDCASLRGGHPRPG